jgi:hypothetical protein
MIENHLPEDGTIEDLLISVARCPEIMKAAINFRHPCHKVVCFQKHVSFRHFQLPEPWNGHIEKAPLLFISSNPGYAELERVPTRDEFSWTDDRVSDFFINRFGGGKEEWVVNGKRALQADGTHAGGNVFWPRTRLIAADLLENPAAILGEDFAITEVVHCKSREAEGVPEAGDRCTSLHLDRILDVSPAKVLVVFGALAKPIFQNKYPETRDAKNKLETKDTTELIRPLQIAGKLRYVIFHRHPSANIRYFRDYLTPEGLAMVRTFLS